MEVQMYKVILVPLDGSKRAESILPHVEELALCSSARVVFLEVVEPIFVYPSLHADMVNFEVVQNQQKALTERCEAYLAGLLGEFRGKNISAKSIVEIAPVVSTIIDVAIRENADLIAMASHGRTGLSHVFYGSVAAGVLHRIDRPMLIIRAVES